MIFGKIKAFNWIQPKLFTTRDYVPWLNSCGIRSGANSRNDRIWSRPNRLTIRKFSLTALTSDEITVLDANLVSDEIIEIRYEYGENFVQPDSKTNVVIAAFTTTYARLQLYEELDMLQERVLYYDTDSVIYLSQPGQPEPRLGNYIGDLTDKLGGEHITVFASGGPKNDCYQTNSGKTEVKVRGITLDCTARQKVNFDVICALVFLRGECGVTGQVSVDIPFRITRNTQTKEIQTKRMKKDYRIVYNKRVIKDNYKTLRYGY